MDIGSILLGVALLLVVAFVVARPLLDQAGAAEREPGPADALLFERERVLMALRDLDFDHAMGKTLDDDYAAQREQLLAQGAAVLKQLDSLAPGVASADTADDEIEQAVARLRQRGVSASTRRSVDDEIEAGVAARRAPASPAVRFCGQCGRQAQPADKFCGGCGQPLPAPAPSQPARAKH
jgi:hypothetical protein